MTQAFNLALFANNLNTSGATTNAGLQNSSITVNTTTPITGGATTALGSSLTLAHATSGVAAATYTAATITVNASGHVTAASSNTVGAGTVTSVATGNGLSGGTITTTGTLVVACPTAGSVGSYATVLIAGAITSITFGTNYAAGAGATQMQAGLVFTDGGIAIASNNQLSGTWKWMGCTNTFAGESYNVTAIACRVS